ncbi:MAG: hypothetical protein MUF34_02940 [Polyangiaceae bacterium]|jgi:hypothetical protein|nr:hypothetical protein [Polyangiaceae bacterium]
MMNAFRTFSVMTALACGALGVACDDDDDVGAMAAGAQGRAGASAGMAGAGAPAGTGGASSAGAAGLPAEGPQRVVARNEGGPRAGVDVLVHDAAGTLRSRAKTDDNGVASVALVGEGSVSLVYEERRFDRPKVIATYYGLDGKAELTHLVDDTFDGPLPPTMSVRVAVSSPVPGVDHYLGWLSCLGSPLLVPAADASFVDDGYAGCGQGAPYDVLVMAFDEDDRALGYGTRLDVPFAAGAKVTLAVAVDRVDLVERSFVASGVPAAFAESLASVFGDRRGARYLDVPSPPDGGASASGKYWVPPALFDRVGVSHRVADVIAPGLERFWQYEHVFEGTTPLDLAWAADRVASFESLALDLTTTPARPAVTLRATPDGELGDALTVELIWQAPFEGSALSWTVVAPPTRALTLRAVELPDDLAAYRPAPAAHFELARATLLDDVGVEGLAGFLRRPTPFEGERQTSSAELRPEPPDASVSASPSPGARYAPSAARPTKSEGRSGG